jgi:hypothetical protein
MQHQKNAKQFGANDMNAAEKARMRAELRRRKAQGGQQPQERGLGAALYDNIVGNPNDGVTSYGESLGTWLRRGTESATLGLVGDEVNAAGMSILPGRTYEGERDRLRADEENMSGAGRLSADIAGALVPGAGIAKVATNAGGLGLKMLRGAAGGAASGATYGFMEGEGTDDRIADAGVNAVAGGVLGGAVPAAGAVVRSLVQGRAGRKAIAEAARNAPTSEALRAQGNALYRQVDDAGVQVKPEAFDRARSNIIDALRSSTGYDELPGPGSLTPNTSRVVEILNQSSRKMADEPTAALPFSSLDQMRRQAGAAAGNVTNKTDQKAGVTVIRQLDDFVQSLGPEDLAGGDADALKGAIGKAREVWGRMSRSQMIDDAMEKSENYLSGTASGLRNQFKNILQNKKLSSQFTDAEKAALRSVTHGNALEQLVNLAGGGLAQMGSIGGGFAAGGVPGAMVGTAAAAGQRRLAEAVTMRAAEKARAAIASGQLRSPEMIERLAISGERPEFLTNTVLNALTATSRQ